MKMTDILIIIGIAASLIFNLTGLAMDLFGGSKRKKIDEHEENVISGYMRHDGGVGIVGAMNNQIVYKVNGDFNGNIKGDNVTVILMGNGNINGNIESKDGNVVLIKGNVNGDIKANKVICPTNPTTNNKDQHICKSCYHYVQMPIGSYCTESSTPRAALPVGCNVCKSYDGTGETTNYKSDCTRFSNRSGICHFFHVNGCSIEHNCPYKIKRDECKTDSINDNTPKYNQQNEAKCSDCVFAENKHYISASSIFSEGYYDCSKFNKTVNEDCSACLEFKSRSKNKDVESPKLQVETLWSCDIPQGTSPEKRIDHYTSIGNCVSIYGSSPVTHITCPHCKKHFATQLRVRTSVVDGDVVETSVEEMRHDY